MHFEKQLNFGEHLLFNYLKCVYIFLVQLVFDLISEKRFTLLYKHKKHGLNQNCAHGQKVLL